MPAAFRRKGIKTINRIELKGGFFCGLALAAGILAQQVGLAYTTVGKAGFIASLYILITPVIGLTLHKRCPARVWISICIALSGMYFLCLYGQGLHLGKGDSLMLAAAFLYAVQMQVIDHFVERIDPLRLSCLQMLASGLIFAVPALLTEAASTDMSMIIDCWLPIVYGGIISCGLGYTFQTIGQWYTEPNRASLLLSSETVFTLLAGMVFFNEILKGYEYAGCAIVLAAILLSQTRSRYD